MDVARCTRPSRSFSYIVYGTWSYAPYWTVRHTVQHCCTICTQIKRRKSFMCLVNTILLSQSTSASGKKWRDSLGFSYPTGDFKVQTLPLSQQVYFSGAGSLELVRWMASQWRWRSNGWNGIKMYPGSSKGHAHGQCRQRDWFTNHQRVET
jgi:hypothetical protein